VVRVGKRHEGRRILGLVYLFVETHRLVGSRDQRLCRERAGLGTAEQKDALVDNVCYCLVMNGIRWRCRPLPRDHGP